MAKSSVVREVTGFTTTGTVALLLGFAGAFGGLNLPVPGRVVIAILGLAIFAAMMACAWLSLTKDHRATLRKAWMQVSSLLGEMNPGITAFRLGGVLVFIIGMTKTLPTVGQESDGISLLGCTLVAMGVIPLILTYGLPWRKEP